MSDELRSIDEQIYDFLSTSQLTYKEIGERVGCAASTVSSKARKMVKDYNLNPSVLRTSQKTRYYGRYCHNLACHELIYLNTVEIKKNQPGFCSEQCASVNQFKFPSEQQVRNNYKKYGFEKTAKNLRVSYGFLARLFEHYNITPEEFPENVLVTPANVAQRQTQRIKQRRSYGSSRAGHRKHLGFTVRSSWENNFCLYLNYKNIEYDYEPKVFYFPERTGASSYVPDYRLNLDGKEVWVEVKGRIDSKDRTKMRRLKEHYPEVFNKMTYIAEKPGCKADLSYKKLGLEPFMYYNDLVKEFSSKLKHWES